MQLLSELHRHAGDEEMWVTGHSLGAAVVLVAARRLAEEQGIVLSTHLFNPPNISADVLAKKLAIGTANGLGFGAGKIPVVGGLLKQAIRGTASVATYVAEKAVNVVGQALVPDIAEQASKRNEKLFLTGFCPNLYVNPNDFICNEYIPHLLHLQQRAISGPSAESNFVLFSQFFGSFILPDGKELDMDSCHLIPRAVLHVNHWATGPWHAHKLTQWYRYDLVKPRINAFRIASDWTS